jgi:ribonuclease Z
MPTRNACPMYTPRWTLAGWKAISFTSRLPWGEPMKIRSILAVILALITFNRAVESQERVTSANEANLNVILLGTAGGPTINTDRVGISTLVLAGPEKLLFDCGRGLTTSLARLSISPSTVTKVFLTHLHSDHIVSLPELYLFPWASQGRQMPLQVWGPEGTRTMMKHVQEAFAFDIHIRRDVDERFSPDGIKVIATDIREGVVHEANGVKVIAFLVDHGPVQPAFGYRVDYRGRSVVMSGDTKPSDNLVKFSQGVDVLIHEVGRSKQDPALIGPPDEVLPGGAGNTRRQAKTIADHHTDATEASRVFQRVNPKLAVFSHANPSRAETLSTVRQGYSGRVEFGADLMTIDIGNEIIVHPFDPAAR